MNYTPNLNLKKPAKTDPVLIDDLNDNMDILDQEVKGVRDVLDISYDELQQHKGLFLPHGVDGAGFHNSIYRGKFLGNEVTSEQWDRIADGTFRDMYIGDYWTINGTTYLIAAFNYYYYTGDQTYLTKNHVTLVTAEKMYDHRMNPTNTTEGGYVGSEMYISGLDQAKTKIHADFAGHVLNHRKYLSNAVSNGQASGAAWFDSEVELMSEVMAFGSVVNSKGTDGSYNIGTEKSQLPLFSLRPDLLNIRTWWWLRGVAGTSTFAGVNGLGFAYTYGASLARGVRPVFSISA